MASPVGGDFNRLSMASSVQNPMQSSVQYLAHNHLHPLRGSNHTEFGKSDGFFK